MFPKSMVTEKKNYLKCFFFYFGGYEDDAIQGRKLFLLISLNVYFFPIYNVIYQYDNFE